MKYKLIAALLSLSTLVTVSMQSMCAQSQPADADPRHNAIYSLLQAGKPREALSQLNAVATPGPWDFYMRGQACQMIGEPLKAAEWYKTAVSQDAQNNLYRTKAVDALLAICKCDEAIQLCSEGSKLASDSYQRQRYDSKIKDIEKMKANFALGAEHIARHKREHASQLQQAMETSK